MITRLEYGGQGNNPRYVVTNLSGDAKHLYDDLYCQRREAENRIKEAQVGLFANAGAASTSLEETLSLFTEI